MIMILKQENAAKIQPTIGQKAMSIIRQHLPIHEQTKVVGHAVRAMYLLSAVADLAHESNDPSLLETCERLWDNLVTKRMYLTGAIGPSRHNEGFTEDYDLPDETAYAETCATNGLGESSSASFVGPHGNPARANRLLFGEGESRENYFRPNCS